MMTIEQSVPQEVAIRKYLGITPPSRPSRRSCFVAALVDARKFTRRDTETGKKIPGSKHGCWLGALGYMALLDQIGSCLNLKGRSESGNQIERALKYFSNLSEPEIQAVYALRCAFAHNYSLANVNKKRQDRQHVFTVCVGSVTPLVQLPRVPWSDDYSTADTDNRTVVNLEALGDLVESVCQNARGQAEQGNLEIVLAGGVAELLTRYFFSVR